MQTFTGLKFNPFEPDINLILIEDIAHSLSLQCRYNGHCNRFYSIAEHSLLLSNAISINYAIDALLHDSAEAYLSDIIKPIKELIPEYEIAEDNLYRVIAKKFNLLYPIPKEVQIYDHRILVNEKEHLMKDTFDWGISNTPKLDKIKIRCFPPKTIERLFLDKFYELTNGQ